MAIVRLTTKLDDVDGTLALYDYIQYWRSTTGSNGTYFEITSRFGGASFLLGSQLAPFTLFGLYLDISLNGANPVSVIFPMAGPLNIEQVVNLINEAMPSSIAAPYPEDTRRLLLTNPTVGTQSTIQVSGSAASVLGLSVQQMSGTAPRTLMGNKNTIYKFADYNGDPAFFYKTRFWNSLTDAVSTFSSPQAGGPTQVLQDTSLVVGQVNLSDATGRPIIGRRIILVLASLKQVASDGVSYGLLPSGYRIELITDEKGHAETPLTIGSTIRVFFEGSGYSREFVVPSTDFDILAVASTQPDPFTITPAPPMPIRES